MDDKASESISNVEGKQTSPESHTLNSSLGLLLHSNISKPTITPLDPLKRIRTSQKDQIDTLKGLKRINTAPCALNVYDKVHERGVGGRKRQCRRIGEDDTTKNEKVVSSMKSNSDSALSGMEQRFNTKAEVSKLHVGLLLDSKHGELGGGAGGREGGHNSQRNQTRKGEGGQGDTMLSDLSESEMSDGGYSPHPKKEEEEEEWEEGEGDVGVCGGGGTKEVVEEKPQNPHEEYEDPMTVASDVMKKQGWSLTLRSALDEGIEGLGTKSMFIQSDSMYSLQAVDAVRGGDIVTLRELRKEGTELNASNKFGESLSHMACRRSNLDVLKYLVEEGGCDLKRCDDFGRTVLHDAFWTVNPNFDLVKYLMVREGTHAPGVR